MRKCVRFVSSVALGMIMSASFATAAIAQGYPDEPPLRFELASGQADFDGTFRYFFTAPDVVNETYFVFVVEEIAALANETTESGGEDDVAVLGSVQTPDDGSSLPTFLIGGGILVILGAGAGLYGLSMRSRYS